MIAAEKTVLILLASGLSRRFGDLDKLEQPFLGKPLAFHVVTAFEDIPFQARFVIKNGTRLDFEGRGYQVIHNDDPAAGMARSVKLGVERAKRDGAQAVLIALADMPRVTASHVYHLLEAADSTDAVVASSNGRRPCPPAVFAAGQFDFLLALQGDAGARDLVRAGKHVVTSEAELIDVDTPEDLARLRALVDPRGLRRPLA
jgi:molybdenum cofactor cytidylyltransferase